MLRVAVAEMVRALRVVTVQRGVDPREYALLAFGGAGPLHAAAIAEELGMSTVLCPRTSGVLAALGLVVSQRRRDLQRSVFLSGESLTSEAIEATVDQLAESARQALGEADAEIHVVFELRYRGQSFELPVAGGPRLTPGELRSAFEAEHEQRYGYRDSAAVLELVTIRVSATIPGSEVELTGGTKNGQAPPSSTRRMVFGGRSVEAIVVSGVPDPGTRLTGPAAIELPESTILIPPGWTGEVDQTGTTWLRATAPAGRGT